MKDKDSEEWSDAVKVWKATRMRSNGTWSVPNGEEIMNKFQEEGEKNQEKISSTPVPLVEHFSLVLRTKPNYSRGVRVRGITSNSQEKSRIIAEVEAAKKRAEQEVERLTEITKKQEEVNIQLKKDMEAQREELTAQGKAIEKQNLELKKVKDIFVRLAGERLITNLLSNDASSNSTSNNENNEE